MIARLLSASILAAAALLVAAPFCLAQTGPVASVDARIVDSADQPETRAGTPPDRLLVDFTFDLGAGNLKDLMFKLPAGFLGNANAIPTCPRWMASLLSPVNCPSNTQVGVLTVDAFGVQRLPLHNLEPGPGYAAEFGFKSFVSDGRMFIRAMPNGQVRFEMSNSPQTGLPGMDVELWGVPADHQTAPTASPRRAFLTTGTRCDGTPQILQTDARSWQAPDVAQLFETEAAPPLVGCDALAFQPQLGFAVDSQRADSPTGLRTELTVPQNSDPEGVQSARVKDIEIDFPAGLTLSPSAAHGLVACPEEAVGIGRVGPTGCPDAARIGSLKLESPLLREPVSGGLYIGRQQGETLYSMYMVASDPSLDLKLRGSLRVDPASGQLHATIGGVPEATFERLTLDMRGGSRALVATPMTCGNGAGSTILTSHSSGSPAMLSAAIATTADPLGRPCPDTLPFTPTFVAGTTRARAGAATPFVVTIRRDPGEQLLDRLTLTLPKGVSARIAAARRCPNAAAATGDCPADSRVGSLSTETGSGDSPFPIAGDIFLTGPYRGAPFGMALVFDAVAGPFDLGRVVVRATLRIHPRSGQITIETDRLPQMVRGVPLRLQTIGLDIDRPGFIGNPTSCKPAAVTAALTAADGRVQRSSSRFGVGGCRSLRFRPAIALALTDRDELRANGHPGVRVTLRTGAGGANLRDVSFAMPKLIQGSFTGPTAICARTQLVRDRCPDDSRIGSVVARTPVLSKPLRGAIYSVQPPDHGVADVWGIMKGAGMTVRFRMDNVVKGGRVRGRIVGLPDIPLSRLSLAFDSGRHSLFTTVETPCARGRERRMATPARLTAHSAAARRLHTRIRAPGC